MTIKTKIIGVVIGLMLALSATLIPASPAGAHQWDGYSNIYCEAHKSASHVWVNHSWPVNLQPGLVTYKCTQYDPTIFGNPEHQYYVVWHTPSGAHWRQGGYQWCGAMPSGQCIHH